jgi:hypothetical protein
METPKPLIFEEKQAEFNPTSYFAFKTGAFENIVSVILTESFPETQSNATKSSLSFFSF